MAAWVQGVVFAAIAAGLLYWLSPEGATEKLVRAAVAVFMLTVMLAPLTRRIGTDSLPETASFSAEENEYRATLGEELQRELTAEIEDRVRQTLTAANAQVLQVDVALGTDTDGTLTLQRLHVTVAPGSDVKRLERLLLEQTGWTAQIDA